MSAAGQSPGNGERPVDAGEGRLAAYLAEVAADPPGTDAALARRVRRSARWQQTIRGPLEVIGHLTGAFTDGIAVLLGERRRPGR